MLHIFQDSSFLGSKVFWIHVFKGPGFSGSGSSVWVQVLEVALCIYTENTLRHRCSSVNLLHISEHIFIRTPLKGLFLCLNFDLFAFVLLHSFYVTCGFSYHSINLYVEAATGRSSTKKLHCIFTQKLLEVVHL